jgi:hypothetical protein
MPDRRFSVAFFPVHYGGLVNTNEQRNLVLLQALVQPLFPDMIADRIELPWISFIYGLFRPQPQVTEWQRRGVTVDCWETVGRHVAALRA